MLINGSLLDLVVIFLVVILCDNESALIYSEDKQKYDGNTIRHTRTSAISHSANGYPALDKDKIKIEFLLIDRNHIARVSWKPPAARAVPIDGFLVSWTRASFGFVTNCTFVSNETTTYDIRPSSLIWNYDDQLFIIINPLPRDAGKYDMITFIPDYTGVHHATPNQKITQKTTYVQSTTNTGYDTRKGTYGDNKSSHQDEYSSKLIIGSVIGVSMAIVLIIILVKSLYEKIKSPPHHKDNYYVSCYAESVQFINEVKEFVSWLHRNGFGVEMLTDEDDMLREENRLLRRELVSFKFREHMVKTSDKVFIILSPSYLKLCEMNEDDARNQNVSEEEKLVYDEVVQIRCELHEQMYRSDRFIPILFRLNEAASIPFWIKELVFFSWPEDKATLLNRLNGLPECPPDNLV